MSNLHRIAVRGLLFCIVLWGTAPQNNFDLQVFGQTNSQQYKKKLTSKVNNLPAPNNRFALIIGVETYDDQSGITSLKGPNNDAIEISKALKQYAGFQDSNIVVISSQADAIQPNATNIYAELAKLANRISKDGLLFIAFSGHGIERNGHTYLLPANARLLGSSTLLEVTSVDIDKIKKIIATSLVKQVIILLDSCREDPSVSKGLGDNNLKPTITQSLDLQGLNKDIEAFAVIYATSVGKRSYINPNKLQGYFSSAFVEGLSGKAKNKNNEVTLSSLIKYLEDNVPKQVRNDLGSNKEQKPWAKVEGYKASELVLVRLPQDKPPTKGDERTERKWSSFLYRTIGDSDTGWSGEFRRQGESWIEYTKGNQQGRIWQQGASNGGLRIRLEDGSAIIEIDPSEMKIYYTDIGYPGYPVLTHIYTILDAR